MVLQMPSRRPVAPKLQAILNYQRSLEEMCKILGEAIKDYAENEEDDDADGGG